MPSLDQKSQTSVSVPNRSRRADQGDGGGAHSGREDVQWSNGNTAAGFHALLAEERSTGVLAPPPTPARHVPRPRLFRRLQRTEDASVILLAAPAGYGKSALLSEWAQRESRPLAWLTLTALDNDPDLLLERLAEALSQLAAPWPASAEEDDATDGAAPAGPPRIDLARLPAPLRAQAATLNAIGCDRVLVLDDVHNVRSLDALRILAELIGAGCAQLKIALASRAEPQLELGRLRASGRLVQLGPDDLEMTADEARRLLKAAGLVLEEPDLLHLVDYTEGWAAALFLAAVSLRSRPDAGAGAVEAVRDAPELDEYVREEVLATLTARQRGVLSRTSVLRSLSPGLCDAVLDMDGSGEVLQAIAHRTLMLTPQHGTQGGYLCHSLVRDVLRRMLELHEPQGVALLHERASVWFAEHGDAGDAVEHAVAARDTRRAGALIWDQGSRYISSLDRRLAGWLEELGEDQVAQSARLALAAAFQELGRGDAETCERWARKASAARSLHEGTEDADAAWLDAGIALAHAAGSTGSVPQMLEQATHAWEALDDSSAMRPLAALLRGVALQLLGELGAGHAALEDAVRGCSHPTVRVEALGLTELALAEAGAGDWELASDLVGRAQRVLADHGLDEDPMFASTHAGAALVLSERGQADDAKRELAAASRMLGELGQFMCWYEVRVRTVMARACVRLADVSRARTLLAEASRWARRTNRVESLVAALDAAWAEVDDICATALDGPGLLTIAELRILRFLPTHLSFREIGERLHVSGNTVKTQAHAVYTKLGASSRSEAVAKASAIGLIDVTIV
ncbi:MAG TPA: LuxR C-terminal-related transcriptional regulator [Solirubrobacteraceae bacterium]|jgi:LuxR family maltose regulon positive regulatory protein|nr:LuxR C-terminal-related transcriptional regulator [Solirubrobacteraceae bacterium]